MWGFPDGLNGEYLPIPDYNLICEKIFSSCNQIKDSYPIF
jgi:hypothetical protein